MFIDEEYKEIVHPNPNFIIDAGANVGYSTVYLANKYPKAHIVAVEPEDSNFAMLSKNLSFYPLVKCVHSGIWSNDCYIRISNTKAGKWGFVIEEVSKISKGAFKAVTIDNIIKTSGFKKVEILKMDIEGSEKEVFSHSPAWISQLDILAIEVHDHMKKGCEEAVFSAMKNFEKFKNWPNYLFIRKSPAALGF